MRSRTPLAATLAIAGLYTIAMTLIGSSPAWLAYADDPAGTAEAPSAEETAEDEARNEADDEAATEKPAGVDVSALQPVEDEPSAWDEVEAAPRLRYPALCPAGESLVFTYQSDLYRLDLTSGSNRAVPLSVHLARELRSIITPDGAEVVFAAQYHGQYDLYVMPIDGGEPRRLTQHEAHEYPSSISPDGEWVLYYGWRDGATDLFMTRLDGTGTPIRLTDTLWVSEYDAIFSPDGRHIAYCVYGSTVGFFRPGFRGYNDSEIYVAELVDGQLRNHRRITHNTWHDMTPGWVSLRADDGEVRPHLAFFTYGDDFNGLVACDPFASDDPETPPSHRPLLASTDPEMPYRAPVYVPAAGGGFVMVAEDATGALTKARFDVAGEVVRHDRLDIRVVPMPKVTVEQRVVTNSDVDEFALSPNGEKLAYVVNGEVFLTSATGETDGLSLRVTHTAARESQVSWTPDGEYLVYATLRRGTQDIVLYDIAGRTEYWLVKTEHDDCNPVVSPQGNAVLYTRNDRELRMIDLDGSNDRVFYDRGLFPRQSISSRGAYAFSPKGHWVAFAATDPTDLKSRIFIAAADGSTPARQVTTHHSGAFFPQWTADKKYLTYYASRGEGYTVFAVELVPEEVEFTEDKLEALFPQRPRPAPAEEAGNDNGEGGNGDDNAADSADASGHEDVPIVFTGIRDRARQIVNLPSNEWYLLRAHDGSRWLFLSNLLSGWQLWTVNHNGGGLRQVTTISGSLTYLQFTPNGRHLYFLNSGRVRRMAMNNFNVSNIPTRAEYEQNLHDERLAVYDEIGWVFGRYFYDPAVVQEQWYDLHDRFRPAVKGAVEDDVFRSVLSDLMGQLNYSHLGVGSRPGRTPGLGSTRTGELGLRFDSVEHTRNGYLRISQVIGDGPADQPAARLRTGEYLRAINGMRLSATSNLDALLRDTTDTRVRITVGQRPPNQTDPQEREVSLRPVSRNDIRELRYREWVESRRRLVEEWSNGEFGYIHVPRMRGDALQAFHDELADMVANKSGVIIDVRYNGGGSTAVHMLATLYRVPWLERSFRDVGRVSENVYRDLAWERPAVTMTNASSFSNAEIFAEGFQRMGIGPVIGQPTGGGVIGTSSYTLVDGSTIRTPLAGAFTVDGEDLERNPRLPDIWVDETPTDRLNGADPQLQRSLEELRRQSLYYVVHGERPFSRGNDREQVAQEMVRLYDEWLAEQAESSRTVDSDTDGRD